MRIFNRGADVTIQHTFYDSTGGVITPTSARLTISYPSTLGFPLWNDMESTYVSMSQLSSTDVNSPLGWQGTWNSISAAPGIVYWNVRSDDFADGVADGSFLVRGNPANVLVASTT